MGKYALGLDYGTLSVRALLIDSQTGEEIASSACEYAHGVMEKELPTGKKLPSGFALQDPRDYMEGLILTVKEVMSKTQIPPEEIIGIGIDFTASTILPVKADKTPLCYIPDFQDEPHAYVKLWKHHGGEEEANIIAKTIEERGEDWISRYGGKVSSETMLPKIFETLRHAPAVYEEADRFIEAMDWLIWNLTGEETRSACCTGYKAYYHHETGYPSKDFLKALDPGMENLIEEKMDAPIKAVGERAGYLTETMAKTLGLQPGTPVGTGIIDGHSSILGCGVGKPGTMVMILGTSAAHFFLSETELQIPGSAGAIKDGVIKGYFGCEAGQSCVGDHFAWFVKTLVPESYEIEAREKGISVHQLLVEKLEGYKAGQSGLIALDWFNGVRSPLMDFNLNGMILGMNLLTKPEEIYLALIEATAYGTRMIIDSFEKEGVSVDSIILCGGIPLKNRMLVQVYSDICKKEIRISESSNASAMGAAILGVAAAEAEVSGYKDASEATEKLGKTGKMVYRPNPENTVIYDNLYEEYKILHKYFGTGMNDVMKRLNAIRDMQK
ncbi:MAG: ribulokinase [Tyzzerella sp.]|nr:ribulokinase [Tyzzerella sp.]